MKKAVKFALEVIFSYTDCTLDNFVDRPVGDAIELIFLSFIFLIDTKKYVRLVSNVKLNHYSEYLKNNTSL